MSFAQSVLEVALWVCLGAVVYAYVGYPVVVAGLARLCGRRRSVPAATDADLPLVSLLIAAYNEEAVIDDRIRNALASDYPADKLEIVIATDGCSDQTPASVRKYADRGVRLLEYPRRRGKATVLNDSIPQLWGEFVMLSDANTYTEPAAVRNLVRWFRDPAVGSVCGKLVLTDPATGKNADGVYWKYETFLKRCESRLGALLGANGGIYAIRKAVYAPLPTTAVLDDLLIPLLAKLRTGCDIVFEPAAVAHEETAANVGAEFQRRSRIGAGGFGSLSLLVGLLNPRRGWVAFTFLSHKVLRWLCPFALVGLFATNLLLVLGGLTVYQLLLIAQAAFYTTALVAAYLPGQQKAVKLLRLTTMFASMNWALLMGFGRWLRGTQGAAWRRTARTEERHPAEQAVAAEGALAVFRGASLGARGTKGGRMPALTSDA